MHRLAFVMLALVLVGCESRTEGLTALDSEDDAICRKSVSASSAASYDQSGGRERPSVLAGVHSGIAVDAADRAHLHDRHDVLI